MTHPAPAPDADLPPIRKEIEVPLPPEEAFRLWTEDLGDWWPVETHSLSAGEGELPRALDVEPRTGGRITETRPDGTRAPWARITAWEPGARLGLLWHVGRDEADATEVEVLFAPSAIGTRVTVTHTGFGRLGTAATALRDSYGRGWALVLGTRFRAHCITRARVAIA